MTKFGTILADPPWQYKRANANMVAQSNEHYTQLSIEDLCELPVREVAADDAYLFLWTTKQHVFDTSKVAGAWGFPHYSTTFYWTKVDRLGTSEARAAKVAGRYAMGSTEQLLLFRRGKPVMPRSTESDTFWTGRTRVHSEKPDAVYDFIEKHHIYKGTSAAYPVPRLELFARSHRERTPRELELAREAGIKVPPLIRFRETPGRDGWTQVGAQFTVDLDGQPDGEDIVVSLEKLAARE
jgi:N6-adenosine-specific RNA methylase IME4